MNDSRSDPKPASNVWLDVLAFVIGLAMAWVFDWQTADLIWSLWLSSLLVGYAMIVWKLTAPLREVARGMAADHSPGFAGAKVGTLVIVGATTLFGLAFFTVHFGGFHYVHSAFLNLFFPVDPKYARDFPHLALYVEIFRRYWWFVPAAAIAEREGFRRSKPSPQDTAVTAEAIKARKARGDSMMQPYKNVIRLHLLIFFFAFAHFVHLANFWIYAVAYAVYFFPWRILKRANAET